MSHSNFPMYEFDYSCLSPHFPNVIISRKGFFISRELFEEWINYWSIGGYTYFQTDQDAIKNKTLRPVTNLEYGQLGYIDLRKSISRNDKYYVYRYELIVITDKKQLGDRQDYAYLIGL